MNGSDPARLQADAGAGSHHQVGCLQAKQRIARGSRKSLSRTKRWLAAAMAGAVLASGANALVQLGRFLATWWS